MLLPNRPRRISLPGKLITGRFYESPTEGGSAVIPGESQGFFGFWWQPAGYRIDDLTVDTTVVGSAGALIRLGVYGQGDDGKPFGVLVDAGTVAGTILGVQTLPGVVSAPGVTRPVFLTGAVQGGALTRPTLRTGVTVPIGPGGTSSTAELNATRACLATSLNAIPGAFPNAPALAVTAANFNIRVLVRGTQLW